MTTSPTLSTERVMDISSDENFDDYLQRPYSD